MTTLIQDMINSAEWLKDYNDTSDIYNEWIHYIIEKWEIDFVLVYHIKWYLIKDSEYLVYNEDIKRSEYEDKFLQKEIFKK